MLIPFSEITKKYNMNIHGILHIGAHNCEELDTYRNYGLQNDKIIWVEANPELVKQNLDIDSSRIIKNFICCDTDIGTTTLNIANNGQSSSILEFGTHEKSYPHIKYNNFVTVKNCRIDTMYRKYNIPLDFANFLNIDIQGAELLALKGMGHILNNFDYAYLEVNSDYVYKNCALIGEIDEYLVKYNFIRAETKWTEQKWGDALYIKSINNINNNINNNIKKRLAFDIGSNIGKWTDANINNYNKIISIEASPITFERLKIQTINHKDNLLNYAVCNNNFQDVVFYHANADAISTINKNWLTHENSRFYNQPYKQIRCRTTTIDKLIEIYGKPDLIKIDVEGGEYECILSLTQKVDLLCFEWASETNNITFNCIDYLFRIGFTKFYIQMEDEYTFQPNKQEFVDLIIIKNQLIKTTPKKEWGMIWCM